MGIVRPVDSGYKRAECVAEGTPGAGRSHWAVYLLEILHRRGACAALDEAGRVHASHAGRTRLACSVRQGRGTGGMVWERDGDQGVAAARAVCH